MFMVPWDDGVLWAMDSNAAMQRSMEVVVSSKGMGYGCEFGSSPLYLVNKNFTQNVGVNFFLRNYKIASKTPFNTRRHLKTPVSKGVSQSSVREHER